MELIYAIAWGFFTAQATGWIDDAMDYGKILSFIRFRSARSAAKKSGMLGMFDSRFEQIRNLADYGERITAADEVYWVIAGRRKPLVGILCKVCLGTRVHIIFSMLLLIFSTAPVGWEIIFFYLFSGAVSYYFVK